MAAKKKEVPVKKASPKKPVAKKQPVQDEPGEQVAVRVVKPVQPQILQPIEESEPAEPIEATIVAAPDEPVSETQPEEDPMLPSRKSAKRIAISALILLVVLLVGGVAYTWYTDQKPVASSQLTATKTPVVAPIQPSKPRADAQESAAVEFLTTPVAPGDAASVNVRTYPTSTCVISVSYGSQPSTDPGLTKKTADAYGGISWDWTVPYSAPTGTWPVKVTCTYNGRSAFVEGDLQVAK